MERDSTNPVIAISEASGPLVEGNAYNRNLTITVMVTDAYPDTQTITLDGAWFRSGSTVSAEGNHTLLVSAQDKALHPDVRSENGDDDPPGRDLRRLDRASSGRCAGVRPDASRAASD